MEALNNNDSYSTNVSSGDNCTEVSEEVDYGRGISLLVIALIATLGNFMTIFIMLKFKTIKIPDLLVIALAVDDLIATLIPMTMSIIAYFRGVNYEMDGHACNFFGVIAAYTRFTAALLVTVISVERYLAVKKPLFYRKHCTPSLFKKILVLVFIFNAILAFPPAVDPNTPINEYRGFCLFSFTRIYAMFIVAYAIIQFVIVLFCFICIVKELYNLHRRRKHMTAQNMYNKYSSAASRDSYGVTFTKSTLVSKVSDLGQRLKKTAPAIGEWLQLSIEAQFARMLLVVTILFYINWMPTVILIMYTMAKEGIIMDPNRRECTENTETILFWTIRATVIGTALNPLLYGFLAQQYRGAYIYLLKTLFSKCCYCISAPTQNVFLQDRKQHVQWNKDPPIQQVNYKNIGTYRPRYFNGYNFSNPSITSGITTQTNLSLPDLATIPEGSIISVENGELTEQVLNASDGLQDSDFTVTLTHSTDPHLTRMKSASMDELRDDVNSRCTLNPLHNSDDSNLHTSSTSKDELLTNDNRTSLANTNPLHISDEPSHRQMNGFVHQTLTNDDQSNSSNESDHIDCAVNNNKNLSTKFHNDTKDTSILALAAVI